MGKIKNLKIYSKNIAKITINGAVMFSTLLPFVWATSSAIKGPILAETNQTMFRDELEYPALVKETFTDNGETTSELTYIHPRDVLEANGKGLLTVTSPWEQKGPNYERTKSEYELYISDISAIQKLLDNKENWALIKDQLKLINVSIQKTDQINDTNELSYTLVIERMDYSNTITQKESLKYNILPFILGLSQIIISYSIIISFLTKNTIFDSLLVNRKLAIDDAVDEIKKIKLKK
jgi:hypothetical protein